MKAIRWVLIGALFALLLAGCYTKLVHPPVTDDSGTYYHPRKDCSDCHSSADYYYYHFPYQSYYGWGRGRYWQSYYWDPWWYHNYWWWDDDDEGGLPTGTTRYYDERERPDNVPRLVPPAEATKSTDDQAPKLPEGGSSGEVKEKPKSEDSGSRYFEPRARPESPQKPKQEPKEQKKEEKKAEDKK
jgi:hypothetical protein